MLYKNTVRSSNLKENFKKERENSLQGSTSSNVSSCPLSLQGGDFARIGTRRRRLRIVEIYGEKDIDEILPVFVKVIGEGESI